MPLLILVRVSRQNFDASKLTRWPPSRPSRKKHPTSTFESPNYVTAPRSAARFRSSSLGRAASRRYDRSMARRRRKFPFSNEFRALSRGSTRVARNRAFRGFSGRFAADGTDTYEMPRCTDVSGLEVAGLRCVARRRGRQKVQSPPKKLLLCSRNAR